MQVLQPIIASVFVIVDLLRETKHVCQEVNFAQHTVQCLNVKEIEWEGEVSWCLFVGPRVVHGAVCGGGCYFHRCCSHLIHLLFITIFHFPFEYSICSSCFFINSNSARKPITLSVDESAGNEELYGVQNAEQISFKLNLVSECKIILST